MTSSELANHVRETAELCAARIEGIGAEQYENPDGTQAFESESLMALAAGAEEELLDLINYAVMMRVRLQQFRGLLKTPWELAFQSLWPSSL